MSNGIREYNPSKQMQENSNPTQDRKRITNSASDVSLEEQVQLKVKNKRKSRRFVVKILWDDNLN